MTATPGPAWQRRYQPWRKAAQQRIQPPPPPLNCVIQETSGSTTGTSLTLTLPAAATLGNAIIIAVCGFRTSTISGITLGGTGSLFGQVAASSSTSENAQIWLCSPVSVASGSIVITAGAAGIIAYAYEVDGWLLYNTYSPGTLDAAWPDQTATSNSASGTSWSSGATPATLGAAEIIVGIGSATGTPSVTISGPATGQWTNETAINGIAGSGGYHYSGISGYQTQTQSGTYSYSGSTSASTAWGAVTATFLLMPNYDNWGGYIFTEHTSYTGISATFTIPSLTGETNSIGSIWVGLGDVYQTGISLEYNTSYTGDVFTQPWSEWVPGPFENWDVAAYPTKSGDSLTLTVQLTSTSWLMTITNNTQNWTHTEVKSVLAVNIGQLASPPAGPAYWPYPVGTAEVIIEDEGDEETPAAGNPNYGSVTFTSITTTPPISQPPHPWATVNTVIDQYPGPFNLSSNSFTMYWNGYL